MIDIETFISNLQTTHQLTPAQTRQLLDAFEGCGIQTFGLFLSNTLKENAYQQMVDQQIPSPVKMLPIVCTDSNLRSCKTKNSNGWKTTHSDSDIDKIINIAGDQVYRRHHQPIYLGTESRKKVSNIIKKSHCLQNLENNTLLALTGENTKLLPVQEVIKEICDIKENKQDEQLQIYDDMSSDEISTEDESSEEVLPEWNADISYDDITDCSVSYYCDMESGNVFKKDGNHDYVGKRVYDDNMNLFYVQYKK
jgi:hypothetical protein